MPLALLGGPDNFTARLRENHSSCRLLRRRILHRVRRLALVELQLPPTVSTAQLATNQIVFTDVDLDDFDFTITSRFGAAKSRTSHD